jgi:hypothetical protein
LGVRQEHLADARPLDPPGDQTADRARDQQGLPEEDDLAADDEPHDAADDEPQHGTDGGQPPYEPRHPPAEQLLEELGPPRHLLLPPHATLATRAPGAATDARQAMGHNRPWIPTTSCDSITSCRTRRVT